MKTGIGILTTFSTSFTVLALPIEHQSNRPYIDYVQYETTHEDVFIILTRTDVSSKLCPRSVEQDGDVNLANVDFGKDIHVSESDEEEWRNFECGEFLLDPKHSTYCWRLDALWTNNQRTDLQFCAVMIPILRSVQDQASIETESQGITRLGHVPKLKIPCYCAAGDLA